MLPIGLDPEHRPLTDAERRVIRAKARRLVADGRRASKAYLPVAGGVFLVLWLWTLLASDASWPVVTGFWLVAGGGITLWVRQDLLAHAGQLERMAHGLESALRRNAADVYDVRARAFAELEEIGDEGACYAFDIGDDRLAFVSGQEFYEGAMFPSLDFSLVYVLDERGDTVDVLIDKRGEKADPARTIRAFVKRTLDVPDHLEVRTGRIDDFEVSLGASSGSRWTGPA